MFSTFVRYVRSTTFVGCCTLSNIWLVYENLRQCTTTYDNVQHVVTAYSTMFNNVRQKILPYDRIFVAPKSFTRNFFLIRSIAYENLRLTTNNHDTSRQHSNNYDFLIRTLSHLKIRMWESSITACSHRAWQLLTSISLIAHILVTIYRKITFVTFMCNCYVFFQFHVSFQR